jgi:CubicO group peptidase (beta-lactamase class C family)
MKEGNRNLLVTQKRFRNCLIRMVASCALFFLPASAIAQDPQPLPPETVRQIEAIVASEKARLAIPGLSLAIAVDNKIRYAKGFGLADVENSLPAKETTVYRTASIAKSMTATALMQLVEQGKIDLDAPIQKYCPAFPEKAQIITARLLLAHQSGIRHYKNRQEAASTEHYSSIVDSLKIFKDEPLLFEPGAKYSYTTYGYSVLGCAIEGASGLKYEAYMAKNIFQPAGMTSTRADDVFAIIANRARGYIKVDIGSLLMLSEGARKQVKVGDVINAPLHDTSAKVPGGGLVSTAVDLVRFAIAVNTKRLVKPTTLEQMWTEQKARDGKETRYGFGWGINQANGQRMIIHNGGQAGTRTDLRLFPEKGIVIAVMTNLSDAPIEQMIKGIQEILLAGEITHKAATN